MNTITAPAKKIDTTTLLSTLWIVVTINMLKADILSLYIPGSAEELARTAGDTPIPLLMLGAAIMMEISIVMIILSRVLKYGVNRWANIIEPHHDRVYCRRRGVTYPHYLFIATVEVDLPVTDRLVCLEVAQPRSVVLQMCRMSNSKPHQYRSKRR